MTKKGDPNGVSNPGVEIGADVKARRLRFQKTPETSVEFHGGLTEPGHDEELESASGSERENLPDEVEAGVTYRDIRIRWRAAARIKDSDRPE